ncbi:MAG: hypothetical protein AMS24_03065 [Chlamydiae bacterium SM23_39]|nr:MAG: hypothetical protein AMS24_03065 [Chlamydiae bacterium SM23_39]
MQFPCNSIASNHSIIPKNPPGFGIPIGNYQKIKFTSPTEKINNIALLILLGSMVVGLAGVIIVSTLVGTIALIAISIDQIRSRVWAYRFRSDLPASHTKTDLNAPHLGSKSTADVLIVNNAENSFKWKKELLSIAETSIEFSPNFAGGEDFREILDIIKTRMTNSSKLRTHILLSNDLLEKTDISKLNDLNKTFGNRFKYLITNRIYHTSPYLHSEENHVKMLVVDGKYFVIGGTGIHPKMDRQDVCKTTIKKVNKKNFSSKFFDQGFRDTDLVGKGQIALTLRSQFFSLFQKWENRMRYHDKNTFFANDFFPIENATQGTCDKFDKAKGLIKNVSLRCFVGGPEHRKRNPITHRIAMRINKATQEIRFGNLLFNPDEIIKKELQNKNKESIKIAGHFNSAGNNSSLSHWIYVLPNRTNYSLLTNAYEYDQPNQLYHKKVATFDKKYTIIGSYNLGQKSASCDDEIILEIKNADVAKQVNEGLKEDVNHSKEIKESKLDTFFNKIAGAIAIGILGPFFG